MTDFGFRSGAALQAARRFHRRFPDGLHSTKRPVGNRPAGYNPAPLFALLMAIVGIASGQALDPVKWSLTVEPATAPPGARILAHLTATIEPGWHLYGLSTPPPSRPTTIKLPGYDTLKIYNQEPKRAFDKNFDIETQTYEGKADFLLETTLKADAPAGPAELAAAVGFNVCDATRCLPPRKRTATASLTIDPKAPAPVISIPGGFSEFKAGSSAPAPVVAARLEEQ